MFLYGMVAQPFVLFLLTATNGGRIPLLKFTALERDEGAPCADVARGSVSYGWAPRTFVFSLDGN
jgi:hypothetical protein